MVMIFETSKIYDDFQKIKDFLKINDDVKLEFNLSSDEGFFRKEDKTIIIGLRHSMIRTLLIHECLHATGKHHNVHDGFVSVIRYDTYSAALEKSIFIEGIQ